MTDSSILSTLHDHVLVPLRKEYGDLPAWHVISGPERTHEGDSHVFLHPSSLPHVLKVRAHMQTLLSQVGIFYGNKVITGKTMWFHDGHVEQVHTVCLVLRGQPTGSLNEKAWISRACIVVAAMVVCWGLLVYILVDTTPVPLAETGRDHDSMTTAPTEPVHTKPMPPRPSVPPNTGRVVA